MVHLECRTLPLGFASCVVRVHRYIRSRSQHSALDSQPTQISSGATSTITYELIGWSGKFSDFIRSCETVNPQVTPYKLFEPDPEGFHVISLAVLGLINLIIARCLWIVRWRPHDMVCFGSKVQTNTILILVAWHKRVVKLMRLSHYTKRY